ncbi:hypothetical protein RIR_jg32604.t1 [Rhizophagus irregularis DAOM 181602=DAOM 197198]|nr:hypothetical protein RIR_jg32604.t1 [Rhizophagus irregularis DAOM 181602=DAOM 197198]
MSEIEQKEKNDSEKSIGNTNTQALIIRQNEKIAGLEEGICSILEYNITQQKYPHKTSLGKYIFIFFIILLLTKSVIQSEDNIGFISTIITGDFESFINFLQQLQNNTSDLPTESNLVKNAINLWYLVKGCYLMKGFTN